MLRVMIVDDHPIVREGLRGMLAAEPDIEVAGEAASGDEAVALVPRVAPDVVLMDLRMPSGDGVSAIERLPGHRILVLTTFQDDADIVRAIKAGAAGYLLKDASRTDLAAAVRDIAAGRRVLSPEVSARLAAVDETPAPPALSTRESEVLALVAEGLTNAQIGERLYIGQATVKTHLLRIFTKLGVSDRTAAVMTALEHGILSVP
ncbi:response regulator transcription factor [Actinomadura sp. BRA 177]|uniref:response regulator n=1 Tax=Actinomadura sp. BRA 177 TaxID=2745202 RepID=UPI0015960929|nr:response regulator transcription factor [Actinomadura sp. BRA 177]NVI91331.1 response regulator transcription factor [Actinomadura sp. BRA 177]